VIRLLLALLIVVVGSFISFLITLSLASYPGIERYAFASLILIGGFMLSRELAAAATDLLRPKLRNNALVIGNALSACGFVLSAIGAASFAAISATGVLASAAVGGIVLGLALQPTLGSFFAGLLILGSGTVRPGSQVRILNWHIPFQWAFLPGYKYFSPDAIYAGYMGQVVAIGLFFTSVATEEGQMMKIPNTVLATDGAIIVYSERDYIFNVRYEFSVEFDPAGVIERVSDAIKDYPVMSIVVNEQSDKQFYILKIVLNAKEQDHAVLKSEILTKIIRIHNQLQRGTGA
jgi:small-conductance mechanosensitive channel